MVIPVNHADAAVFDREGTLALIIEVKTRRGTDADWAARMRRNMVAHGFAQAAPFFLLAMPDRFYLWKNSDELEVKMPDYEVDPTPYLGPYSHLLGVELQGLSEAGFELLVVSWFQQLLQTETLLSLSPVNAAWLLDSGLWDSIKQGTIVTEPST